MTRDEEGTGRPSASYPSSERAEMLDLVPAGARSVLDVGCHAGGFGEGLRRQDPTRRLWAVEADPAAAAQARPIYDHLIVGTYPEALDGCTERFDCIVFNDVLEHMLDPWASLRLSADHLTPAGAIVASIPNIRYVRVVANLVIRGDWAYTDQGILDRTHLRFFTARTIRSLFADTGFVVERLEGIHSIGHIRFRYAKVLTVLLGEFAYSGFAVRAHIAPS